MCMYRIVVDNPDNFAIFSYIFLYIFIFIHLHLFQKFKTHTVTCIGLQDTSLLLQSFIEIKFLDEGF